MSNPSQSSSGNVPVGVESTADRDLPVSSDSTLSNSPRLHLRLIYFSFVLLAGAIAFLIAVTQKPAPDSHHSATREFEGIVTLRPYPALLIEVPRGEGRVPLLSRRMLTGQWPGALDDGVTGALGQIVRLRGRLLYRAGLTAIEVEPGSVEVVRRAPPGVHPVVRPIGPARLRGEVWDIRCYLGAMRPGSGRGHEGCSLRNVREGVAPLFVADLPGGGHELYVLRNATSGPFDDEILPFVGRPVYAEGIAEEDGGVLHFRTDPGEDMRVLGRR